jgi:CBS domain containing-hemolysin-like protein
MLKMTPDSEDPSSSKPDVQNNGGAPSSNHNQKISFFEKLRNLIIKPKNGADGLREALEEYIEELEDNDNHNPAIAAHEQALISNILKLRKTTIIDVMIPRADIAAIEVNANQKQLMELLSDRQFSRIPVYDDTLDEILGTVHIKDILSVLASKKGLNLKSLIRPVPIVSPSLPVLDLLLKMQSDKKHMVMVVDEYGGIDGLATIGDVIEAIVGEFDDEFDKDDDPEMVQKTDGSIVADARVDIEEFEEVYGKILSEEEREEVDTLGGLVFYTASRIPARGEVIKHESGMIFEILEADQRRINSLRIRNIPNNNE